MDILNFLNLPSIPKKEWDGEKSFKEGIAEIFTADGTKSYALCTFDSETMKEPRIKKTFTQMPFVKTGKIFPVPDYMNEDVDTFDLSQEDKERARGILEEAKELTEEVGEENKAEDVNEWSFDNIHNMEEAEAFVHSYRKKNRIKGSIPKNEENMKAYLAVLKTKLNHE